MSAAGGRASGGSPCPSMQPKTVVQTHTRKDEGGAAHAASREQSRERKLGALHRRRRADEPCPLLEAHFPWPRSL